MKIVKMHKGSREAFDDFLEQRLNEVEIDNDMADKYFANMNLPVPVIPAPAASFFAKYKNRLWLLMLLFITSIASFLFVNNNTNTKQETVINKSEANSTAQNNVAIDKNDTQKNKEIEADKSDNVATENDKKLTDIAIVDNNISVIKNEENKKSSVVKSSSNLNQIPATINNEVKTNRLKTLKNNSKKLEADFGGQKNKEIEKKAELVKTVNTQSVIMPKPIVTDKKVEAKVADSLYIIW
jgi:hypothetical protein